MGMIVVGMILLWCVLAGVVCWAFVSGTASLREEVKFKVVEDDEPIAR